MFLLARRHVRRAHRAVEGFAAYAEAAAHLHGAAHAAVFGVVEVGRGIWSVVAGAIAKVRGQRLGVHDLARVEQPVGIEHLLHLPERVVKNRTEHLLRERTPNQAVTVLARQSSTELEDEIGDRIGDRLELRHALGCFQIHHRADVQAADRGVRVDAGDRVVVANDLKKPLDVVAEPLGRDRGVLDKRQRLRVAFHRHRQPQRCLAKTPDPRLIGGAGRPPPAAAEAGRAELAFELLQPRQQILGALAVEFDAQQRPRLGLQNAAP